jgi:CxxC motif-containing protein (DUF1111 family)
MERTTIGRFGWKAQVDGLADFVRSARVNELGLANDDHQKTPPPTGGGSRPSSPDLQRTQSAQLTILIESLPRPEECVPDDPRAAADAALGKRLFTSVGCAECHVPDLGGVHGLYSDLLLHDMGEALEGTVGGYDSPSDATAREWRTPPLWGVADSAPYLHDGRAPTLRDAIRLHGGTGADAAKRFGKLRPSKQEQLLAFLGTLRAPRR